MGTARSIQVTNQRHDQELIVNGQHRRTQLAQRRTKTNELAPRVVKRDQRIHTRRFRRIAGEENIEALVASGLRSPECPSSCSSRPSLPTFRRPPERRWSAPKGDALGPGLLHIRAQRLAPEPHVPQVDAQRGVTGPVDAHAVGGDADRRRRWWR